MRGAGLTGVLTQAFEAALKDVLKAKRLSQSKMATLTKVALDCMDVRPVSLLTGQRSALPLTRRACHLYSPHANRMTSRWYLVYTVRTEGYPPMRRGPVSMRLTRLRELLATAS